MKTKVCQTDALDAMCAALKPGGIMYLAFPNRYTLNMPSRKGALNFYDVKPTHKSVPDFHKICLHLISSKFDLEYHAERHQPMVSYLIGMLTEPAGRLTGAVTPGTSAYWGAESVIWARKKP